MAKQQRKPMALLLASVLALAAAPSHALGLLQAFELALQNDPTYRQAYFDSEHGKEFRVIGRAALLPTLQGNYGASKVRADQDIQSVTGVVRKDHPEYISRSASVQLRQPLFSLDSLARYKQGVAQSNYSEQRFASSAQDLALRLIGAYIDAIFAEEQLNLAQAQRDMYAEQHQVNRHLFQKGEGTRTDMLETESRLALAEAQLIETRDTRTTSYNTLASMIGGEVTGLDGLAANFRIKPMEPAAFEGWRELALANNPDLQAQTAAIESARQDVNRARAGHTPRVDFVASYSKSAAETLNTYNQDSVSRSIGVQINIPLYSGGAVNAGSRQAVALMEKARVELQAHTDKTLIELRKQYNLVLSSTSRIRALEAAVESGKLLVQATEQSIKGGVRINLDLLNARQQLFTSQRDLAQARYGYLLADARMRAAAGVLGTDDVRDLATYFR